MVRLRRETHARHPGKEGGKGIEPGPKPHLAQASKWPPWDLLPPLPPRKGAGSGRLPTQSSTVQRIL